MPGVIHGGKKGQCSSCNVCREYPTPSNCILNGEHTQSATRKRKAKSVQDCKTLEFSTPIRGADGVRHSMSELNDKSVEEWCPSDEEDYYSDECDDFFHYDNYGDIYDDSDEISSEPESKPLTLNNAMFDLFCEESGAKSMRQHWQKDL
eukprot:15323821-Ditylum_brightwellii.AAC.1